MIGRLVLLAAAAAAAAGAAVFGRRKARQQARARRRAERQAKRARLGGAASAATPAIAVTPCAGCGDGSTGCGGVRVRVRGGAGGRGRRARRASRTSPEMPSAPSRASGPRWRSGCGPVASRRSRRWLPGPTMTSSAIAPRPQGQPRAHPARGLGRAGASGHVAGDHAAGSIRRRRGRRPASSFALMERTGRPGQAARGASLAVGGQVASGRHPGGSGGRPACRPGRRAARPGRRGA